MVKVEKPVGGVTGVFISSNILIEKGPEGKGEGELAIVKTLELNEHCGLNSEEVQTRLETPVKSKEEAKVRYMK